MVDTPFITPNGWFAGGRFLAFRGRSIFYREGGKGEPVLFLHGFPTASWDWHAVWPGFSQTHRVFAPDFIGFGFSERPVRHAYRIAEQADIAEALMARIGVATVDVIAHDYGNTVAQELLARDAADGKGRVRSVCFLNGGLFPEAARLRPIQHVLLSPFGALPARFYTESIFARTFRPLFGSEHPPDDATLHACWEMASRGGGLKVMHRLIGYVRERHTHRTRWVEAIAQSEVPRRFVVGMDDPVSGAAMAARYRELIPDPDVVELPGVGHYPQLEVPHSVVDACLPLLS